MASLNDWQDPVFPEQQAQIIYKQFLLGRERLKEITGRPAQGNTMNFQMCPVMRYSTVFPRVACESIVTAVCDTDNDEDKLLTCDLHVNSTARTILNILSIVNTLESKHEELEECNIEKEESIESEDEVFSSPISTPRTFSDVQESELESTDTSVSQ